MESGANLLLGTDNGLLNSPNLFAELDFTYKLAKSQYGDAVRPDPAIDPEDGDLQHPRRPRERDGCGYLEKGLPATFVVLDFHQPHLRATQHISRLASSPASRPRMSSAPSEWATPSTRPRDFPDLA